MRLDTHHQMSHPEKMKARRAMNSAGLLNLRRVRRAQGLQAKDSRPNSLPPQDPAASGRDSCWRNRAEPRTRLRGMPTKAGATTQKNPRDWLHSHVRGPAQAGMRIPHKRGWNPLPQSQKAGLWEGGGFEVEIRRVS